MPFLEFLATLPWAVNVLIVLISIAGYIGLFLIANGLFCAMMDAIGRRLDGPPRPLTLPLNTRTPHNEFGRKHDRRSGV